MIRLKPNEDRAKFAVGLIWVVLILDILSLISGYLQYDLLQTFASGGEISNETIESNDSREQIIGLFYLIAFIISAVTFILWFRRAYFNLHQKINYLSHSEGWAAGSWFVPFISLYRPYQIMKELYQETADLLKRNNIRVNSNFTTSLLGWWWGLWLLSNAIGQFVFRYSNNAVTIDELTTSTIASMIGNLVSIPLALITIKVIQDYADIEPQLDKIKIESEPSVLNLESEI
jgi:hypothetical protein